MKTLKIAMVQMLVEFDKPTENMKRAEHFISLAAKKGAQICVIPECADLGWGNPKATESAEPIPGEVSNEYCRIAQEYCVFLAAGLTERFGDKIYNAALLISDKGEILLHHRKINVLTGVEDVYSIGNSLSVADTPFGKIGIDICADNALNSIVLGHTLARMGAQIILSPSSWAVEPCRDVIKYPYGEEWLTPYKELARLYHMSVIGVSNVGKVTDGTWKGWKSIGNSIAVDNKGNVIKILPYGEDAEILEIVEVTVEANTLKGTSLSEDILNRTKFM